MKLGYFESFHRPDMKDSYALMLDHFREQAVACEQLGFESVWIAEHHFNHGWIDPLPNPILLGGDIAARTKRIRIGQACLTIPMWHPIRLAEDIAQLDQMSNGRVEVGIGKGIRPREGMVFHPNADARRKGDQMALFEEVLDVAIKAWTEEFFSHEGKNFTIPARGTPWTNPGLKTDPRWYNNGEVTAISVIPRCFQKPHPPIWMVSDSDSSLQFTARRRMGGIVWQPTVATLKSKFRLYQETRSAAEGRPFALGEKMGLLRAVYVAPTMEEARRDAEAGIVQIFKWVFPPQRPLDIFAHPHENHVPAQEMTWDFLMERDNLLIGDPDTVAEQIAEIKSELNPDFLFVMSNFPYLSQAKIMRSLDLLATRVMPMVH